MYQNFIIPYLDEAQHVSGDTPPIIRSLKLHWQPLVLHRWRVVGRVVAGRCQVEYRYTVASCWISYVNPVLTCLVRNIAFLTQITEY